MKSFSKIAVITLAAAGVGLAVTAYARGPGGDCGPGAGMRGAHGFGGHGASVETHLDTLKSELKLTGNQTKAWEAFETAARDQGKSMEAAHSSMQAGQHTPDAHIAIMEQRLAGMKTVQKARTDLYNVLTPEQKTVFDRAGPHGRHG